MLTSITFADEPHGAATYAQSRAVLQEAPPHETDPKAHADDKILKRKTRPRMKRKKSRWTGGMQRIKNIENKERDANGSVDLRTGLSLITISGVLRIKER